MSNNLNITQVTAAQTQKEVTINQQAAEIDAALTEAFIVTGTTPITVTAATLQLNVSLKIDATVLDEAVINLPTIKRLFLVDTTAMAATDFVTLNRGTTDIQTDEGQVYLVYTDGTANGLVVLGASAGGGTTFLGLTDTPSSYTGEALKLARVNAGETALEFIDPASLGGGTSGTMYAGTQVYITTNDNPPFSTAAYATKGGVFEFPQGFLMQRMGWNIRTPTSATATMTVQMSIHKIDGAGIITEDVFISSGQDISNPVGSQEATAWFNINNGAGVALIAGQEYAILITDTSAATDATSIDAFSDEPKDDWNGNIRFKFTARAVTRAPSTAFPTTVKNESLALAYGLPVMEGVPGANDLVNRQYFSPPTFKGFNTGVPGSDEVLGSFVVTNAMTLDGSLPNSYAKATVAATAETVLSIGKNAVEVGTITFAAAATVGVFALTAATPLARGDLVTVVAPTAADATLANITFVVA